MPTVDIHNSTSSYFGRTGDSGAAIFDKFEIFVGLFFAGNDLKGVGYFTAAKDLFSDIKRMTFAEEVDLLPISWAGCKSEPTAMPYVRTLILEFSSDVRIMWRKMGRRWSA